jgi:hypothetical protein
MGFERRREGIQPLLRAQEVLQAPGRQHILDAYRHDAGRHDGAENLLRPIAAKPLILSYFTTQTDD